MQPSSGNLVSRILWKVVSFDMLYSKQSLFLGKTLSNGKSLGGKGSGLTIRKCVWSRIDMANIYETTGTTLLVCLKQKLQFMTTTQVLLIIHVMIPGPNSWCSYNKDKALNTHFHKPIKNYGLRPAVRKVMLPLFKRLSHEIIWCLVTKDQFNSPWKHHSL